MSDSGENPKPAGGRYPPLSIDALRALAHPLRVQIMNELSDFGPLTASGLASRLGESSGATSYHLRQLAKHNIIREVEGKGSARERWWEIMPGGVSIGSPETFETRAGREATELISREWQLNNERRLSAFMRYGLDTFGMHWVESSLLSTAHLKLTPEQLKAFGEEYQQILAALTAKYREQETPGARRTQIQFNAFPLIDEASDDA
ncbi:ArsR/SmtB family transcription factor [Diaminobutyricibacter sp. McL0618]|uniref:ArsR/SmtB family transcription factor n=1 Tax=Leifsonia sp. McL0618 TaxID=3415677 RepID=UPI003CF9150D